MKCRIIKRLLFFLLISVAVYPQNKIDSIFQIIKNKPEEAKFKYLSDQCWRYRYDNTRLSLELGDSALTIARKMRNRRFEAQILNRIGVIHKWANDLELSMHYSQAALLAAKECQDSIEIGYAENNIGGTYQSKMFNSIAIEHLINAEQIFEKLKFKPGLAACLVNLGEIYQRQQNYPKAVSFFNQALKLRMEVGEKHGIALSLEGIARLYIEKGSYDSAQIKFNEVEKYARDLNNNSLLASALEGLSKIDLVKKDFKNAYKLQTEALELNRKILNLRTEISGRLNLANILIEQSEFAGAKNNLDLAYRLIKSGKNEKDLPEYYLGYSNYYAKKREFEKSLYYSHLFINIKDSIAKKENLAHGDELVEIKKYLDFQNQNKLLQKSLEYEEGRRLRVIINYVMLLIIVIVLFWRYRIKKAANKKLSEMNAVKDMLFGIIAHDLKNPFHTILSSSEMLLKEYDDLSKEDKIQIIEIIQNSGRQTYKLLENLLYWSLSQTGGTDFRPEAVTLSEIITETIALHSSSASTKNVALIPRIDEELVALCDKEMAKLVLRNLVSNGIKYTREGGSVEIILKKRGKFAEVSVQDNGVGITKEQKINLTKVGRHSSAPGTKGEKGTGLGLLLCKEFVEKNKGQLTIESEEGHGSRFIFTLPLA
jgi:signal transduction histidine kinase